MHYKLTAPESDQFWVPTVVEGILTTPQNKGFDREHILRRLDELQADGHTYGVVDGDALTPDERGSLYSREAFVAVRHAGNRYRIRQAFGSRRHSGGSDAFGTSVPALIVYENDEPAYGTIREYIDSLTS
jgi:hypothetical protein